MKRILLLLLVIVQFNPVTAQKDDTASQIAGAIAGAIVGAAAVQVAVNQYEEQVELIATNYILDNYPEYEDFYLSVANVRESNDFWDPSTVRVNTFMFEGFNSDGINNKSILIMFNDYGWRNEFGVDLNLISYKFMEKDEWNEIIKKYLSLASRRNITSNKFYENERMNKKQSNAVDLNSDNIYPIYTVTTPDGRGLGDPNGYFFEIRDISYDISKIEIQKNKVVNRFDKKTILLPLKSVGNDNYRVSNFSDEFKVIHNENKLGIYLKENKELVQLSLKAINQITTYLNN
tara:strand:- start:422 stop:1291 length:870 start_codon:yes stop_codon:yes gene_type:complete